MSETDKGISRRTLAKGVAWSIPAVAVTAYAPAYAASPSTTTTTLLPCVSNLGATGGTYPVAVSLSGCNTDHSHWDFNFRITAATQSGTDCDCSHLRVTFFDNPKRSRLWISNGFGMMPSQTTGTDNPTTRTENDPRLYVQKVLAAGDSATFPAQGDAVRRVGGGSPYNGFVTDSGTASVGTIVAHGQADDALHTLILPNGSIPCGADGPMAYYRVECGTSANGPWTPLGDIGEINPCVPMIQATVCRVSNNGPYRLGISVLNSCGISASNFSITNVQRNGSDNFPNQGSSVWSGSQALGAGVTNINTTTAGSGGHLWIDFTTDGGVNTSTIRVPTSNAACAVTAPVIVSATNNQTSCPSGNTARTINVTWTGTTTKIQYRVANSSGNFSGDWTNQNDTASPGTISLTGNSKCRAVQVRLCNGGNNQTCTSESAIVNVPVPGQGLRSGQQAVEEPPSTETTVTTTPTETTVTTTPTETTVTTEQ